MNLDYTGKLSIEHVLERTPAAEVTAVEHFKAPPYDNDLFLGDNLPILKHLLSRKKKVQLIYIDPPYASKQSFSHRKRLNEKAYDDILMGAEFVEFLRRRLIFLRELLSEEGSIYVHLDCNMIFQAKIVMDEIFGVSNFRNLICRQKCHSKNYTSKQYGSVADFILFYSKTKKMKWNKPFEHQNKYSFEQRFPRIDKSGRRFALVPIYAPGVRNGETGKPWRGKNPPHGKHWQVPPKVLDELDAADEIYWSPTGNPRRKVYAEFNKGVPVQNVWTKFMDFRNQNMNETGYPTEKNALMLKRIIEASSDAGDTVLDCFCGSGTTLSVADQLDRRWIGMDIGKLAVEITKKRLLSGEKIEKETEPCLPFENGDSKPPRIERGFTLYHSKTEASPL